MIKGKLNSTDKHPGLIPVVKCGSHVFYISSFTLSRLKSILKSKHDVRLLIQIPEGFKQFSSRVLNALSKLVPGSVSLEIDASPSIGSCLMDINLTNQYDLVIHFGHEQYPSWSPPNNVVFERIECALRPDKEVISKLVDNFKTRGIRKLMLYTTQQHLTLCREIGDHLIKNGLKVLNHAHLAFGCYYPEIGLSNEADAVIVISGGLFHGLGAGLAVRGSIPVYKIDPYRGEFRDISEYVSKQMRIRLWKASKASELRGTWLIIAGNAGQYRPAVIKSIAKAADAVGINYLIARSTFINRELLMNIDSADINVIVVTSCPRIPIDDLGDYHKPVITPGEALYALGKYEEYRFPW